MGKLTVEEQVKELIFAKHKSVRDFALSIDMPYSTIVNIFKRGVTRANIENMIKICDALDISVEELGKGKVQKNSSKKAAAELDALTSVLLRDDGPDAELKLEVMIEMLKLKIDRWHTIKEIIDAFSLADLKNVNL